MGRLLVWLALVAALTGSAPAQQPKVALHPMSLPGPLQTVDRVSAMFDSILTAELWEHGYAVVPSAESGKIWKQLVDSVQGFYDPITGDTVRAEFEAVRSGTLLRLTSAFGATVLLRSSIEVVTADWDRGDGLRGRSPDRTRVDLESSEGLHRRVLRHVHGPRYP